MFVLVVFLQPLLAAPLASCWRSEVTVTAWGPRAGGWSVTRKTSGRFKVCSRKSAHGLSLDFSRSGLWAVSYIKSERSKHGAQWPFYLCCKPGAPAGAGEGGRGLALSSLIEILRMLWIMFSLESYTRWYGMFSGFCSKLMFQEVFLSFRC